ncbi:MAG: RsmB/NOP family class I SAM-dependent RNA methyltransferase [Azoarcus sp.]|jgi:16S rRNA (cytosine967-C5)-methyltransferase|nr:RsmB/NOP family class I SAM-dependent RNA methyltransferase [Azoarcus sp.]
MKTDRRKKSGRRVKGADAGGQVLDLAAQALGAALDFGHPTDAVLSKFFREHHALGRRDRGLIAESVYGALRRLRWLHRLTGGGATAHKLLLAWLARGEGWPVRQFDGQVTEDERHWIEALKAVVLPEGTLAERADMPDWLCERLLAAYDEEELLSLAHSLNQPAPLDLRVNILKLDRDAALARLRDSGLEAEPCRWSPHGIRVAGKPALQKHPLFLDGSIEVQDEGSQILGFLVQPKPGEFVADFCAGAGGKTLQLGAMMRSGGRLYALDVAEKRLIRLRQRVARAGLTNVHPILIAHERDARLKRLAGKADRVLVDAPCSGLGTLRRNPDLKWRQTPAAIEEMVLRQRAILDSAAKLVRPGGRLIYATCSLLAEENDGVVDAFLASHPEFVALSAESVLTQQGIAPDTGGRLRMSPIAHNTDGFFAAVLIRGEHS